MGSRSSPYPFPGQGDCGHWREDVSLVLGATYRAPLCAKSQQTRGVRTVALGHVLRRFSHEGDATVEQRDEVVEAEAAAIKANHPPRFK